MQYIPARKGIHPYIQMTPSNIYDRKYVTSNSDIINKIKGVHAQKVKYFSSHNSSVASAWIKTPCLMYHTAVQFSSNGDNSSFLASFKTLPSYVYMYTLKICYLFIFFVRHMLSKSTLYSYSNRFRDLKYSVLLASNTIVSN